LRKFPFIWNIAAKMGRQSRSMRRQKLTSRLQNLEQLGIDTNQVHRVSPATIIRTSAKTFDGEEYRGIVLDGDWDYPATGIEDSDLYFACRQRYEKGIFWEETGWYRQTAERIEGGEKYQGLRSRTDLVAYLRTMDQAFAEIKKNESAPCATSTGTGIPECLENGITLNISRDGDLLPNEGILPLSLAKIARVPQIPVQVVVRHAAWIDFVKKVYSYALDQKSGKIYQSCTHIDLQQIPSYYTEDRFDIVRKNLSVQGGRVLDIGSHWGYFCHNYPENIYFLEKMKRAENRRFSIVPKSVFEIPGLISQEFDVILALNVFHHLLHTREDYNRLISLLQNIRTKEMYFQSYNQEELRLHDIVVDYSEEEYVEFIKANSSLKNSIFLGTTEDGRKLFKLY
jgi:hypothetical protein